MKQLRYDKIGPYTIIRMLGRGGMAEVYQGVKTVRLPTPDGRIEEISFVAAIKVPIPGIAPEDLALLYEEARITARMGSHANIVQVFDIGVHDGLPYIVMEYVTGVSLHALCVAMTKKEMYWTERAVLWVASQILEALDHAWNTEVGDKPLHVVHRDLSPSNVVLTHEGQLKVIDWAVCAADGIAPMDAVVGKARYMPPEQLQSERAPDPAADIYALGAILWELLTGKRFRGNEKDTNALHLAAFNKEPPGQIVRQDAPELAALVTWMLDPEVNTRIPDAAAVSSALDKIPCLHSLSRRPVRMLLRDCFGDKRSSGYSAPHKAASAAHQRYEYVGNLRDRSADSTPGGRDPQNEAPQNAEPALESEPTRRWDPEVPEDTDLAPDPTKRWGPRSAVDAEPLESLEPTQRLNSPWLVPQAAAPLPRPVTQMRLTKGQPPVAGEVSIALGRPPEVRHQPQPAANSPAQESRAPTMVANVGVWWFALGLGISLPLLAFVAIDSCVSRTVAEEVN